MKKFEFTYEQVLEEIKRLSIAEAEGFSIAEMSEQTGREAHWCRRQIRKFMNADVVKFNGYATRKRIDGKPCQVPVYVYID